MTEITSFDSKYSFNEAKLDQLRSQKPWMQDPKYFKRVFLSPSAVIKMMAHGQSGVEKGIAKNGKPIEVMGMLLGRPDTENPQCMIISDAQPLPIEGFETRVVADDEATMNYMIELGDSNEVTRLERFCGWYHTHPFDIDVYSTCFLSSTDISTQLQWQRSEDPHGNPWLAIVIDPLRSLMKGKPEFAAFRVYPPDYSAPPNETPDGTIVTDDTTRVERWGAVWNRYYQLKTQFYMSSLAQSTLSLLKNKFLWQATLSSSSTANESDYSKELVENITFVTTSLKTISSVNSHGGAIAMFRPSSSLESSSSSSSEIKKDELSRTSQACTAVSVESCQCCISENVKKLIFSINKH